MENSIEFKIDEIKDLLIPAEEIIKAVRAGHFSPETTLTFCLNGKKELCYNLKTSFSGKNNGFTLVANLLKTNP